MILRNVVFLLCVLVLFFSTLAVLIHPNFNSWEEREASRYYVEEGVWETESPNAVAAIVWDFRGFDTFGEETVLFTAAVGVFTVMVFGLKLTRKMG